MRLPLRHLSTLLIFVLLFTTIQMFAQSQATTGVIQGRVEDASGAVVPGAKVAARNNETNFSREQTTGGDGRFLFLALPPGPYTVTVTPGSGGFAVLEQSNLNLTVGQSITLSLQMKVAQGSEKIVVTDTPLLDPTKTESSTTIDQQAISATPVLGRKFEDLLTLTPGVSVSQGPDGDEINFNGQRGIFNNISLDGGDYNNGFFGEQMGGQRAAVDISLDAIGEFQVVASGATAEFGRTAGGVVNVITKSGTNDVHGTASYYQRLKALTSNASDGKPIDGFHREQFGGTIGGPIKKDKQFFFLAYEQIISDFTRKNLGEQLGGTPCPVAHPSALVPADAALLQPVSAGGNPDCQRIALLDFYAQPAFGLNEGASLKHPVHNSALLGKWDWVINSANKLGLSYSFDYSKNENQTFDVNTYGASANGTEGPSKINLLNLNLFTTVSPTQLNEFHFTYGRENRPRQANGKLNPDTAIGSDFGTGATDAFAFRFGNPFFLQPNVDEIFWRAQFRDNYSIVSGKHNFKVGGEWMHSVNSQVFRGFFQGRYIFGSVLGFLHYATPSGGVGFGPDAGQCPNGTYTDLNAPSCAGAFSPLFLFLQGANLNGPATDATGFSKISNDDFALFAQDKWQVTRNFTVNYGLRWEAQTFPDPVVPPSQTAYAPFLNTAIFPSDGTLHNQWKQFQPRLGFSWDLLGKGKSVLRGSAGIYNAHQNMLTQVGSITTNGVQQQTIAGVRPTYPDIVTVFPPIPPGTFPLFTGVRAFDKDYRNPRVYTVNGQFEQELVSNMSMYVDFTWSKGVFLTNFLNLNRADRGTPFGIVLGEVALTTSRSNSLYRGLTVGARKRLSNHFQFDANYVYSSDWDTDSNERDPFNDFSGPGTPAQPYVARLDYAHSNRHIPHKFNMYTTAFMPLGFEGSVRFQARSSQPNAAPRTATTARNVGEKGNDYSSLDWRLSRPIKFTERYQLIPTVEMFNTLNSDNNVNTLSAPPLFDFNGFLRVGVGDPRQVQLSLKFKF
jgi:hypothetical protein